MFFKVPPENVAQMPEPFCKVWAVNMMTGKAIDEDEQTLFHVSREQAHKLTELPEQAA